MNKKISGDVKLYGELCKLYGGDNEEVWKILSKYRISEISGYYSFEECLTKFLNAKKCDGVSNTTLANYTNGLNLFIKFAQDKNPGEIEADDIRSYIIEMQDSGKLKKTSIKQYTSIIKLFFKWMYREGMILEDPTTTVNTMKIGEIKTRHALNEAEVKQLRSQCKKVTDKALIEFFLTTGCRIGEVAGLKVKDIDFSTNSCIVTGKGNKTRLVFFSKKTKGYLLSIIKGKDKDDFVFSSRKSKEGLTRSGIRSRVKRLGVEAKIDRNIFPHLLRHTFATYALNSGMNIDAIQELMGHNDVGTTQIYAERSSKKLFTLYDKVFV